MWHRNNPHVLDGSYVYVKTPIERFRVEVMRWNKRM